MRRLGGAERAFHWLFQRGATVIAMRLHVTGDLDVDRLRQGAQSLTRLHPILRCTIDDSSIAASFAPLPDDAPLPFSVGSDPDNWRTVLTGWINMPADPSRPLWECVVLKGDSRHEILFRVHHSFVDGQSVYQLCTDLLRLYDGQTPVASQLLPPLEAHVRAVFGWRRWPLVAASLFSAVANAFSPPRLLLQPDRAATRTSVTNELIVERVVIDRLRERCRSEGTTLNGFYCAALLLAVRPWFLAQRVSLGVNVNLRRMLAPSLQADAFGVFISAIEKRYRLSAERSIWELARACQKDIARDIDNRGVVGWLTLADLVFRRPQQLEGLAARNAGRMQTVFVTNSGNLPPCRTRTLTLEHYSVYAGQHFIGALVWLAASSNERTGVFNFVFTEPLLDRATAAEIVTRFSAMLNEQAAPQEQRMRATSN